MSDPMVCRVSPDGAVHCNEVVAHTLSIDAAARTSVAEAIEAAYPGRFGNRRMELALALVDLLSSAQQNDNEIGAVSRRVRAAVLSILAPSNNKNGSADPTSASIMLFNTDTLPGTVIGAWLLTRLDFRGRRDIKRMFTEPGDW